MEIEGNRPKGMMMSGEHDGRQERLPVTMRGTGIDVRLGPLRYQTSPGSISARPGTAGRSLPCPARCTSNQEEEDALCRLHASLFGARFGADTDEQALAVDLRFAARAGLLRVQARGSAARMGAEGNDSDEEQDAISLTSLARTWVAIELVVDDDDLPAMDIRYELRLGDGRVIPGRTDSQGRARVEGIPVEVCAVSFPDMDRDAWFSSGVTGPSDPRRESCRRERARIGMRRASSSASAVHVVGRCESLTDIAHEYGFADGRKIIEHPNNEDLFSRRPNPQVLYEGDELFIPALETKLEEIHVEAIHQFRVGAPALELRLVLADEGQQPLRGVPYRVEMGNRCFEDEVPDDGRIEIPVPRGITHAHLTVLGETRVLRLGALDPIARIRGVEQRLSNLGFEPGQDGVWGPRLAHALRKFQAARGLRVTGVPDEDTRAELTKICDGQSDCTRLEDWDEDDEAENDEAEDEGLDDGEDEDEDLDDGGDEDDLEMIEGTEPSLHDYGYWFIGPDELEDQV